MAVETPKGGQINRISSEASQSGMRRTRSPRPQPSAVPPWKKNGTSVPTFEPNSVSSRSVRVDPVRWFTAIRLTAALLERLAAEPHTRLRYFGSPQHTDSALFPIIGQMQRAAGLAYDDTPGARLDKLDALLAQTSTSIEHAALLAEMLSLRMMAGIRRSISPRSSAGRERWKRSFGNWRR